MLAVNGDEGCPTWAGSTWGRAGAGLGGSWAGHHRSRTMNVQAVRRCRSRPCCLHVLGPHATGRQHMSSIQVVDSRQLATCGARLQTFTVQSGCCTGLEPTEQACQLDPTMLYAEPRHYATHNTRRVNSSSHTRTTTAEVELGLDRQVSFRSSPNSTSNCSRREPFASAEPRRQNIRSAPAPQPHSSRHGDCFQSERQWRLCKFGHF